MKKVLIIANVVSMIDQFNRNNIKILQELGYEVHVACNFKKGNTCNDEKIRKLKKEFAEKKIICHQINFGRGIGNVNSLFKAYHEIVTILKKDKFEMIHCHSQVGGLCGRAAGHRAGTKVIFTAHGFMFYKGCPLIYWILFYPLEKLLGRWTDVLITINMEDYNFANRKHLAKRGEYVPGIGIDTGKFAEELTVEQKRKMRVELGLREEDFIVLSVGELNRRKNHKSIINALEKLKNEKICLLICGQGELQNTLQEMIQKSGLEKSVRLLGFRTDIVSLMKIADCYIHPSYREGLPVALMEAMASGLPVICSDIRGNNDLIDDGKGGWLIKNQSIDEYKKAIENMALDTGLRKKMGLYNYTKAECFSKNKVNTIMKNIYEEILRR